MRYIYVADVKHGLCMAVRTVFGEVMQIDCGSRSAKTAFEGWGRILDNSYFPSVFVISHFHVDHYNGLVYASNNCGQCPKLRIRRMFYPRIPAFKDREEFAVCLFTMNCRLLGKKTGLMEIDFLNAVGRINTMDFKYESLHSGKTVHLNGSTLRILWPPCTIDNGKTLSVIDRALDDFKRAIEKDEETRKLYYKVKDKGTFRVYLREQGEASPSDGFVRKHASSSCPIKLPRVVERANQSLRKAANHLSLAFLEDGRFLFLGDTEAWEIRRIVGDLQSRDENNFQVFITPHHGTHWSESLRKLKCVYSVTSNSNRQVLKSYFCDISKRVIATSSCGDIEMLMCPTRTQRPRIWQVYHTNRK